MKVTAICKATYPYIPEGDGEICPVCGHKGEDHTYAFGVTYCLKCPEKEAAT
jgi:rRNA maturation endonuclease Nob1